MSALEEYNAYVGAADGYVTGQLADAMRDELLARIEELSKENRQQRIDWMERMNAIELERKGDEATNHALMRAKFNSYNELRKRADDAEQELAEAKAEVERLEAKIAAAEERVERLKALVSYLDDADDHNGLLIMQFEDAEEDAQ